MSGPVTTSGAIVGIILGSFGGMDEALKKSNPFHGFQDADAPNLVSFRVQHVQDAPCSPWITAFLADGRGVRVPVGKDGFDWKEAFHSWEPWSEDDLNAVKDCDDFPCDVKLDRKEAEQMKAATKETRLDKFQSLVAARAERYVKTVERKEYEFPGDPVDPWAYFEKQGLHSSVKLPQKPELWIRKYNLDPKRMKTLHQILDRRAAKSASGTEATLWVRDAYTDHYFDGWGEWATLVCDPAGTANRGVTMIQALFLEVDLLKKGDIISRIGRGKLKGVIEERGGQYLDTAFERIRDAAAAKAK
jgi:hypothetical protein